MIRDEKNMQPLTATEKKIYDFICKVKKSDGNSPSVRDIQREFGFKSTASVQIYLQRLEDKKYIQRQSGKTRSIIVNEDFPDAASGHLTIPVLGVIAAGNPIDAKQEVLFYIDFPKRAGSNGLTNAFGLKVKGESMIKAGIMDGDVVIVSQYEDVSNGDIVAALLDDSATVKRYFKEKDKVRLQPENDTMEPIVVDACDTSVIGKVISVVRYYS